MELLAGIARENTAMGPFAGFRVSMRTVLTTSHIEDFTQLRAAIATDTITLDDGLTRRRWTELLASLAHQPA